MDKSEAYIVLTKHLIPLLSYDESVRHVQADHFMSFEVSGDTGTRYLVEVEFFWIDKHKRNVEVIGSIQFADGRSSLTLSQSFTVNHPDDESR